jgi:2Fe-2S ferredoxin
MTADGPRDRNERDKEDIMGGVNPYITPAEVELPKKKFRITFLPSGKTFEVDPERLPYGRNGLAGSILDIAYGADVPLDHSCGGVCACATCHVIVRKGLEACNEATEDELDQLEEARGLTPDSRLGCQCVPNGSCDIVIEVPGWNRNLVSEDH